MCVWVTGSSAQPDRILHGARDYFAHEPPCSDSDTVVGQDAPELPEVGDPGAQRVMPVVDQPAPLFETVALVCFEVVRVPAKLNSRPSCEKHVVNELRPEG